MIEWMNEWMNEWMSKFRFIKRSKSTLFFFPYNVLYCKWYEALNNQYPLSLKSYVSTHAPLIIILRFLATLASAASLYNLMHIYVTQR